MNEAMQNHKALLIANYTALLNEWNAAMNAGDYARGGELMIAINSYKTELGI